MDKTLILVDPLWYENETLYKSQNIPIIEMMYENDLPPGKYVITTLRGAKSGNVFFVDPTAGERPITNPKMKPTLDFSVIDYVTFIKAQASDRIKTPEDFIAYPSGEQKLPPEQRLANMARETVIHPKEDSTSVSGEEGGNLNTLASGIEKGSKSTTDDDEEVN